MLRLLLISFVTCHSTLAVTLPTSIVVDGEVFTGVVYQSHDASRLAIMHSAGVATFPIASLSAGIQQSLGYDPEAAKAVQAAEAERAAEAAQAEQAAEAAEGPRIKELKAQAANGDAQAAYFLAERYQRGHEVEQSLEKAVAWLNTSANLGSSQAYFELGKCYEYGEGVSASLQTAAGWYRKAAQQGDSRAYNWIRSAVNDGKVAASYLNGLDQVKMSKEGPRAIQTAAESDAIGWRVFKLSE
jgi:TPR repeat protein